MSTFPENNDEDITPIVIGQCVLRQKTTYIKVEDGVGICLSCEDKINSGWECNFTE